MWQPSLASVAFFASLVAAALLLEVLLVLLLPGRLLRGFTALFFAIAAPIAYFSDTYGVFLDKAMLRNVFATDAAEVSELISARLIAYLLLLGVAPCLLILRLEMPVTSWRRRLGERGAFAAALIGVCVLGGIASSARYTSFLHEHKTVRYFLNPVVAVYNTLRLSLGTAPRLANVAIAETTTPATRVADGATRPLVLFLVIGETARAANFQLGGYGRATNPELSRIPDVVYFGDTSSCGTATSVSLPCMFSDRGRKAFDADVADRSTNLLDALSQAGLDVEWRDNNSGCKGVCDRVRHTDVAMSADIAVCPAAHCYDERMLTDLPALLRNLRQDSVIVFHQIGSHGPSYARRYPPEFERFAPACQHNRLDQCSREEVLNAYDNTIVYTDHNLARQIALLEDASEYVDGMLIYASDHGESLGENGLYLHGMPYALAPDTQTKVPFLIWMSQPYQQRTGATTACLAAQASAEVSHDNLFHTVMGSVGVRSPVYDAALDLFAGCLPAKPAARAD
jgi:lipid A ethanolaminephosphotransferase